MSLSKPQWSNETLRSIFQFLDRVNLRKNSLVNKRLNLLIRKYFADAPYDVISKLEVIRGQWWIHIKTPHYFVKNQESRKEIDPKKLSEFKQILQDNKYLRAETTYLRIAEGHDSKVTVKLLKFLPNVSHLWEGNELSVHWDHWVSSRYIPQCFSKQCCIVCIVKLFNFLPNVSHLWEGSELSVRWNHWASTLYIPQCFSKCNFFSAHGLPIGLGLSFFLATKCNQLQFTDNMRDPTIEFPVDQIIDWIFTPAEDGQQKSLHMYATGNSRIDWNAFLQNIRGRFLLDRRTCAVKFFCTYYNNRNTADFREENTHTNERLIVGEVPSIRLRNFELTRVPIPIDNDN